jgi:hypothetical protein
MTVKEKLEELGPGYPVNIGFCTGWMFAGNNFKGICKLLGYLYEKETKSYKKSLNTNNYHLDHFEEFWNQKYKDERTQLEYDMDIPGKLAGSKAQLERIEDRIKKCLELVEKFEKLKVKAVSEGKGDSARKYHEDAAYNKRQLADARKKKTELTEVIRDLESTGPIPEDIKEKRRQDLADNIAMRKRVDYKKTVDASEKLTEELERPPFTDREVTEFYPIKTPWDDPKRMAIKAEGLANGKYWGEFEQVKDEHMTELIARFAEV